MPRDCCVWSGRKSAGADGVVDRSCAGPHHAAHRAQMQFAVFYYWWLPKTQRKRSGIERVVCPRHAVSTLNRSIVRMRVPLIHESNYNYYYCYRIPNNHNELLAPASHRHHFTTGCIVIHRNRYTILLHFVRFSRLSPHTRTHTHTRVNARIHFVKSKCHGTRADIGSESQILIHWCVSESVSATNFVQLEN